MSLLNQVIKEMAVTGAHSVAVAPGGLFGGGNLYNPHLNKKGKRKGKNMLRRVIPNAINVQESRRLSESLGLSSNETNFNAADVVSKLDAAEKKVRAEDDTVSFGLEDEEGRLVRVYVRAEQAPEFEIALASLLGAADENDDDVNSSLEIAEVLFDLKTRFEIVDVNWGDIEADEEEEQEVEGDEADLEGGEEGDMDAEMQAPDGEMGDEMGGDMMGDMGGEDEAMKSTLQQVIDMLKSNAEAQKAEADARAAEAKAKEAEYAAKSAESKIRQEEQVLDMEAYYKNKQDQDKEAKRLAKLAKFKHDQAADAESSLSSSSYSFESVEEECEEEEEEDVLTPLEVARLIFHNLQARN